MTNGTHQASTDETKLLAQLQDILLRDDRSTLQDVHRTLNEPALLAQKINPIVEDHLEYLRKNFPKEYTKIVNRMVEQKLKDSQQEIINVIYPALGKMINKYIAFQFQQLKDSIDERINSIFSTRGMLGQLKNRLLGINPADTLLASMDAAVLEEIFIIERNSGLLLGSAALYPSVNRDVVAGMLTAIKSFVEDAFERENEQLEMIQYGTYRIVVENFPSYYFAAAMSGSVSITEGAKWRGQMVDFIQANDILRQPQADGETQQKISELLENQFITPQIKKLKQLKIKPTAQT